jgi:arylformamidase
VPWLDVSVPIEPGMTIFEGDPSVTIELAAAISRGDVCNVSRLDLGAHSGTHVDAPVHFIDGSTGAARSPQRIYPALAYRQMRCA